MSSPNKPIALDIAIIGGGSAGMALASKLDNLPATVFEPRTAAERDCSWALWAQSQQLDELSPAIRGSWDQWRLVDHSGEIIHHSKKYRYTSLSSGQYLQHCEMELKDAVSLVRAPIENLVAEGVGGEFTADGRNYSAKTIYDSRPPIVDNNGLRQHFVGWEISTKEPIDNANIATLMDFRVDQSRGLHFIYVLPYSDRHLLVESTMISTQLEDTDWYRNAISQWLKERNIEVQSMLREEQGVIPMSPAQPQNTGIAQIGTPGGAVRLSSGYGFSTIQAQMAVLAESIAAGEYAVPAPYSKPLVFMDMVFNRALNMQPDRGVRLFMMIANTLNGEQFARFMLGRAGLTEWTKVVLAMPKWPFIKSALTQLFSHD